MASQQEWQDKLDREFPDGAVASWVQNDGESAVYSVPRVIVTGMNGDYPVLTMPVAGATGKVLDHFPVTNWTETLTDPHLIVVADIAGASRPLQLCAAVTPQMAKLMGPLRKAYMKPGLYP